MPRHRIGSDGHDMPTSMCRGTIYLYHNIYGGMSRKSRSFFVFSRRKKETVHSTEEVTKVQQRYASKHALRSGTAAAVRAEGRHAPPTCPPKLRVPWRQQVQQWLSTWRHVYKDAAGCTAVYAISDKITKKGKLQRVHQCAHLVRTIRNSQATSTPRHPPYYWFRVDYNLNIWESAFPGKNEGLGFMWWWLFYKQR